LFGFKGYIKRVLVAGVVDRRLRVHLIVGGVEWWVE
jgi:hypothetical protein